jgi:hypothetical protein
VALTNSGVGEIIYNPITEKWTLAILYDTREYPELGTKEFKSQKAACKYYAKEGVWLYLASNEIETLEKILKAAKGEMDYEFL